MNEVPKAKKLSLVIFDDFMKNMIRL